MALLLHPRRDPVSRRLDLPGWSPRSRWGWDPLLECFWAELVPCSPDHDVLDVPREHLLPTLTALARVLAARSGTDEGVVFVALTGGPSPSPQQAGSAVPA
ncbi:hypothetical protein N866_02495 [Actinotalea ferrariae CF5-4]|uniref:Uncharacterized protein n=1 Tax=Actinotalea ferrariae CF5-4 TaxID=948458 RepID=A0A021VSY0_9CELL|nr:hypothetical protein [Actinotalea ferrariae]EYR63160.1 hypothetical protein N866_02495 [Actinotalea ferrariae CF5-4]